MLSVLGKVQTHAQRHCRLLFRITFEEQTSVTSVDRFAAQQHVCSAKQKGNLVAYSFRPAPRLHWENVAPGLSPKPVVGSG